MKDKSEATKWTVGQCRYPDCPMTLVASIGGGMWCCWLHALALGLPVSVPISNGTRSIR